MELTKEYFDQTLKAAVAPLATKKDLEEQTEALARIIADTIATPFTKRFDNIEERLDYGERIRLVEQRVAKLEDHKIGGRFSLRRGEA